MQLKSTGWGSAMGKYFLRAVGWLYRGWKHVANFILTVTNRLLKADSRTGKPPGSRVYTWVILFTVAVSFLAALSVYSPFAPMAIFVLWLVNFLVATSSHAVILEETEIINGILERARRIISRAGVAKSGHFLLGLAFVNVIALSAFAYSVDQRAPGSLAKWPDCGLGPFNHVVHVLNETPAVGPVTLRFCANTRAEHVSGWGVVFQTVIHLSTTWTVVTVFWWIIARQVQLALAFNALIAPDTTGPQRHYLQFRIARAPTETKIRVLQLAMGPAAREADIDLPEDPVERRRIQKLAINITRPAGILTFPQTFFWNLHLQQDEQIKRIGLVESFRILRRKYELEYLVAQKEELLSSVRKQLFDNRTKHSVPVLDDLSQILMWLNQQ